MWVAGGARDLQKYLLLEEGLWPSFSFWREGAKPTLQITSVWEYFCVFTVRIDFVRKCKQAGILDDIFEEMLDTLHLAQEKLMDDNTSETGTFLGNPWQGLCCQGRGADLNPGHLALGHLPEETVVLNNSVLSYFCSCAGGWEWPSLLSDHLKWKFQGTSFSKLCKSCQLTISSETFWLEFLKPPFTCWHKLREVQSSLFSQALENREVLKRTRFYLGHKSVLLLQLHRGTSCLLKSALSSEWKSLSMYILRLWMICYNCTVSC